MAAPHQKMEQEKDPQSDNPMEGTSKEYNNTDTLDVKSHTSSSRRSMRSHRSTVSMAAAKARAEAEAAKARVTFSRKEMEIKVEKARLEAELEALKQEREAEAAIAKAVVMEAAAVELSSQGSLADFESLPKLEGSLEKVSEYVAKHAQVLDRRTDEQIDRSQQQPSSLLTLDQEFDSLNLGQQLFYPDHSAQQHFSPRQTHRRHSVSQQLDSQQQATQSGNQQGCNQQGCSQRYLEQRNKNKCGDTQQIDMSHRQRQQVTSHYAPDSPNQGVNDNTSDLAKFLI